MKSYNDIRKMYHEIDRQYYMGCLYIMYEDNFYGDSAMYLVVNVKRGWYVYTYEDLSYTIHNIVNEYEIHFIDLLDMGGE